MGTQNCKRNSTKEDGAGKEMDCRLHKRFKYCKIKRKKILCLFEIDYSQNVKKTKQSFICKFYMSYSVHAAKGTFGRITQECLN